MAAPAVLGNNSVTRTVGRTVEVTAAGWQEVVKYAGPSEIILSDLPKIGDSGDYGTAVIRISVSYDGGAATADVTYARPETVINGNTGDNVAPITGNDSSGNPLINPGGSSTSVYDLESKSVTSSAIQVPIEQHPQVKDGTFSAGDKEGVTAYLLPAPTYTKISYEKAWDPDKVFSVGKREAPSGIGAGTEPGSWLKVDVTVRQQGDQLFEVSETWQYSIAGWDTDIYPEA